MLRNQRRRNIQKKRQPITYQNKDVVSKLFAEKMRNRSFSADGLMLPEIIEVLPTNLPVVEANEMRIDNLFRLKDNSIVIVDYESEYRHSNKIKYLNYTVRVLKKYNLISKKEQIIRMVVIYTGDIEKGTTRNEIDVGCLRFQIEEIFLSELNAEEIEQDLTAKIESGEAITEEEQMQFVILPLIYKNIEKKQDCIRRCVELGKKIKFPEMQAFLLSGLLVFTDKVIRKDDSEEIRRYLGMTKIGKIIQEEIQQAVDESVAWTKRETRKKTSLDIAKRMLVTCLGAKAGEQVLVVTDDTRLSIGQGIYAAAQELGCEAMLMQMIIFLIQSCVHAF